MGNKLQTITTKEAQWLQDDARLTTNKLIPIESIIEYAEREPPLSYQEIADLVGCSKSNVFNRLQSVGYSRLNRKNYEKNRTATLQFLQSKILNSIDEYDLNEASLYHKVIATGILYDKERLESGKSTANISVLEVQGTIADLVRTSKQGNIIV